MMRKDFKCRLFAAYAKLEGRHSSVERSAKSTKPLKGAVYKTGNGEFSMNGMNGKISAVLSFGDELRYSVCFNGKPVISSSSIGLKIKGTDIGTDISVGIPIKSRETEEYAFRGSSKTALDSHTRWLFPVKHNPSGFEYMLEFRIWDDGGFGFRFVFQGGTSLLISEEPTHFNLPVDSVCWYQTDYVKLQGKSIRQEARYLPQGTLFACLATFELPEDNGYAMITEGNLKNYPGAALKSGGNGELKIHFWDSDEFLLKNGKSPWRLVLLADDLNSLVNCKVIFHCNEPVIDSLKNADWIKPGKAAWSYFVDSPISRKRGTILAFNEFTSDINYDYNLIDSGWREWSLTETGAILKVKKIVDDARQRGVGIFVWKSVNAGPYFPLYRKYFFNLLEWAGVKGVKLDHIESETQLMVNLYRKFAEEAAQHKLMVLYHNPQKPTGLSRTYPNLMSMEAIRGLQCGSDADDDTVLPFTRMTAGDADYTPLCFSEPSRRKDVSLAHMLSSAVIYNSSFMTVSEHPLIMKESVINGFVHDLPVCWDETIVLPQSVIGDIAVFARRSGDVWYIAALNSSRGEKSLKISLDFLPQGSYNLEIFFDDMKNAETILHAERSVRSGATVTVKLRSSGGYAGRLVYNGLIKN